MPVQTRTCKDGAFPFVVLEGIPGAGKTKLRDALIHELKTLKLSTHHVGQHGWLSPKATALIVEARRGAIGVNTNLLSSALVEDKRIHLEQNVRPHLPNHIVIADRFYASDVVLLACHGEDGKSQYVNLASNDVQKPDICFVMGVTPQIAVSRLEKSRTSRRFLDSNRCIEVADSTLNYRFPSELCPQTIWLPNSTEAEFSESLIIALGIIRRLVRK